jgi:hypothetical protein
MSTSSSGALGIQRQRQHPQPLGDRAVDLLVVKQSLHRVDGPRIRDRA